MKLIDVKLDNLDQSKKELPYYYRSRSLKITTENGFIQTPTRMTARTEYYARANVPLNHPMPMDLAIDFKPIAPNQLKDFLKNTETVTDFRLHAKKFSQITERAKLSFSFYQPSDNALTVLKNMNRDNQKQFIEMQADFLQLQLGTNILTYPYIDYPFTDYKRYVDKYFNSDPYSTIFVVDMKADPEHFKRVLDYLVQKGAKLIALLYADIEVSPIQHYIIASRYANNENLGFLACQVPRKYLNTPVSGLQALQFTGIDLVAPIQKSTGGPINRNLTKLEFFLRKSLLFDKIHDAFAHNGTVIAGDLDLHSSETQDAQLVKKMIRGFRLGEHDERAFYALLYFSRVHECFASVSEFDESRQLIRSSESNEYFDRKPVLKKLEMFKQTNNTNR